MRRPDEELRPVRPKDVPRLHLRGRAGTLAAASARPEGRCRQRGGSASSSRAFPATSYNRC